MALLPGARPVVASPRPLPPSPVVDDRALIASYLLNFARFNHWPAHAFSGPDAELVLGVVGNDPFSESLDIIAGKTVRGRRLVVRRFGGDDGPRNCHILFIAASEQYRLHRILSEVRGQPVLTVSAMNDFAVRGGMLQLLRQKNRFRILANREAADAAGIHLCSHLLEVATSVTTPTRPAFLK